jgi:hypothetical protein
MRQNLQEMTEDYHENSPSDSVSSVENAIEDYRVDV